MNNRSLSGRAYCLSGPDKTDTTLQRSLPSGKILCRMNRLAVWVADREECRGHKVKHDQVANPILTARAASRPAASLARCSGLRTLQGFDGSRNFDFLWVRDQAEQVLQTILGNFGGSAAFSFPAIIETDGNLVLAPRIRAIFDTMRSATNSAQFRQLSAVTALLL